MKKVKLILLLIMFAMLLANINAQTTIWLIGDSTVSNYSQKRYPLTGWGQKLNLYCKKQVKINNRAIGGRSTKSFIKEKRWSVILPLMKKGDYLFIQFGHNDQKKNKPKIYAPADSLYQELLGKYISEAKAKGVKPILVTSVCRRYFKNGKVINTLGKYPEAMKEVAKRSNTPVIDLNAISQEEFTKLGKEDSKKVFMHLPKGKYPHYPNGKVDNSHFTEYGAKLIASWVVAEAKRQKLQVAKLFK